MKHVNKIFILLLLLFFAPPAQGEDKTVTAQGSSDISVEDAVRQAQRQAVEEAVGIFIQTETEVENFVLQKDKIFSRTKGYIKRFDLLSETKVNGVYEVSIQATVSLDEIKDDLLAMKILLESMERPKLMILIEEEYKGMDNIGMQIAGTELSARLLDQGFELVDKAQIESIQHQEKKRQALLGNNEAAASLGLSFGCQYVVVGKAVVQDTGEPVPGTGLRSIQAGLQFKLIQTQTGSVLGSMVKNSVTAHINPMVGATKALQDVTQKAVDEYLLEAITTSFQDFLNNGTPLKLHITGVDSFQLYREVSKEVEFVPGIVSVKKEGWSKGGGLLMLDLRYKGISEELAAQLDTLPVGDNTLEVVDFGPERVNCIIK